jgi:hypothetical protein
MMTGLWYVLVAQADGSTRCVNMVSSTIAGIQAIIADIRQGTFLAKLQKTQLPTR